MSDLGTLGVYIGSAAAINAANKIAKQADPVPGLIAQGFLFSTFALVGSAWRWDVVKAVAAVMLLGTVLVQGKQFFDMISQVVSNVQNGSRKVARIVPAPTHGARTNP